MAAIERNSLGHQTFFENQKNASDQFKVPFRKARSMFLQFLPHTHKPIEPIREALIYVECDEAPSNVNAHTTFASQTESDLNEIFNECYRGNLLSMSKSFVVRGDSNENLRMQVLCFETDRPTEQPFGFLTDTTMLNFCAKIDSLKQHKPFFFWSYVSQLWGCSRK